ncbi:hypothetical protein SAMN04489760_14818 [Syntrophus gentianae]|uniref:Uncharacterized protein n=1 Tax=Syntrophus gentianae TaxID=43775 RepID=A0A1H8B8P5_9BACT|nr:hypothetical protein [Syntrophus gentianae]SEM79173.1 hypothetical protein SAMN04489760_14818 [Syntrophus gentianae]
MAGFDLKKFRNAKFEPRYEDVSVPDLKGFFEEGIEPLWRVRNLTGHELGKVNEAAERNKSIAAIMEGLVSCSAEDKAEAVKRLVGLGDETPNDVARRLEMLALGSVDPAIDHVTAVRLCTHFPIEFYSLTAIITKLTGLGSEVKKKQSSSGAVPT